MPFREGDRRFWMEVANGECQYEYYDEKKGWQKCKNKAKQVHHIIPESWSLAHGDDPERNVGMPLCEEHHVRNTRGEIFDEQSSFHPDIGEAHKSYREWKAQAEHMKEISGKKSIDYSTSPFAEVVKDHREKAKRGERICPGDESTDRYYEEKMRNRATAYCLATGKKKPNPKHHPDYDPKKKKHWWDRFFGDED